MSSHSSSSFRLISIVLLIFLCIGFAGIIWVIYTLPARAEAEFGAPKEGMGTFQSILYAARLYINREEILTPVDKAGQMREFRIELGESGNSVSSRLEELGLVWKASAFELYLVYSGLDTTIQAGNYSLSPAMNSMQIAHALQDATPKEVEFNVLPGWRAEEIAASLPTSGLNISPEDFLNEVRHPDKVNVPEGLSLENGLEGYLLPGTYHFPREATLEAVLDTILKEFNGQITPGLRSAFQRQGLDLREAVVLASIVQREAIVEDEQPIIASVFFNRTSVGMKLESDPTVQYALGYDVDKKTWWVNPLTADDLAVQSPYNTYKTLGFPPAPICSPSLSALKAVAYPAKTPYYYFRARCDGSGKHSFAVTYEEHLNNACSQP
jgi:UPF0755 protein